MSDLMLDVGLAGELKMAFRRGGWTLEDIKRFASGDMARNLLPAVRGIGVIQIVKHIINLAGDCMPKDWKSSGWKIEKHVGDGTLELDPVQLKLHFSPNQIDGKMIKGHKLREELEANKVPVLNACVLEYLLVHPELIPDEWKTAGYIFFWGTIYSDPGGSLYVRCLCWDGGVWYWYCSYLGSDWGSQDSAASLAS